MLSIDDRIDRYLRVMAWARKRCTEKATGYYTISIAGKPALYSRIEKAAWNKYMENNTRGITR